MATIFVDHDIVTEIHKRGRFNPIMPLLRLYGVKASQTIIPESLPRYLDTDVNIIYALTTRIPLPDSGNHVSDVQWLDEIVTEIPNNIRQAANAGKLHIAYFVGEILTLKAEQQLIAEVNKRLDRIGLSKSAITVYVPNFDLVNCNVDHVKFISIFEMSYLEYLHRNNKPLTENVIQEVNLNKRSKKYTCLNHIQKIHRKIVGASLLEHNLINDGYFSYIGNQELIGAPDLDDYMDTTEFDKNMPYLLDTDDDEVVNYHWEVKQEFFTDAYWNYVTESFVADYHALTEKTYKPIVNLQPFVIVGASGSLKELRRQGYKTFSSVINEHYDLCQCNVTRLNEVIKVMTDLAKMSHEEHIEMMKEIKPILEHNQRVFFEKNWRDFL